MGPSYPTPLSLDAGIATTSRTRKHGHSSEPEARNSGLASSLACPAFATAEGFHLDRAFGRDCRDYHLGGVVAPDFEACESLRAICRVPEQPAPTWAGA